MLLVSKLGAADLERGTTRQSLFNGKGMSLAWMLSLRTKPHRLRRMGLVVTAGWRNR